MSSAGRRLLMVLAAMALLWQTAGTVVAASVACCPQQQACCLAPGLKMSCASCVPGPVALGRSQPLPTAPVMLSRPALVQARAGGRVVHDIWRPPMGELQATSSQLNSNPRFQ
jgi:hypothetical protein